MYLSRMSTAVAMVAATILWAPTVSAHDPGLSTTVAKFEDGRLVTTVRINTDDVADGVAVPEVVVGDLVIAAEWTRDDSADGHIVTVSSFALPEEGALELRLPFIEVLGREHKHHLQVFDEDGREMANELLDAERASFRIARKESPTGQASRRPLVFGGNLELSASISAARAPEDLEAWRGDPPDWQIFDTPEAGWAYTSSMAAAYQLTDQAAIALEMNVDALDPQTTEAETALEFSVVF